jgi:hypothetical protein
MKKFKLTSLIAASAMIVTSFTSHALAGSIGLGVSVQGGAVDLSGTETLKSTGLVSKKEIAQGFATASGYLQYTFGEDGFVFGYEKTPGGVKISTKNSSKDDKSEAVNENGATVTNKAEATIDGHSAIYIETPAYGGFFLKAAYNELTVMTEETLGTGSTYKNVDINGTTIGAGFRGTTDSGIHMKLTGEITDYDTINITGVSGDGTGDENTIKADADVYAVKFSVGYNF